MPMGYGMDEDVFPEDDFLSPDYVPEWDCRKCDCIVRGRNQGRLGWRGRCGGCGLSQFEETF